MVSHHYTQGDAHYAPKPILDGPDQTGEFQVKNSLNRRLFLRSTLSGVAAVGLSSCGGGSAGAAAQMPVAHDPVPVPVPVPVLGPSWVPGNGGACATVATANTFLSQNGNLTGWAYAFGKIVDDFSGGVFNPYWGPLGAMVFHGGGHAATFDNSVVIFDLNDLTFKRLSEPTPSGNGANWISTSGLPSNVDPAFDITHCEYGDGQPGAGHTYDTLAILPPSSGGAPCGSLIRVASLAVHVNVSASTGWSHRFDFGSTTMPMGKWTRWSVNGTTSYLAPGACSAFDSRRQRFWWIAALSWLPHSIRYLDVATREQLEIRYSSTALLAPAADPDSMSLRYDPVRDILVLTCTVGGKLVLAFLRCESPGMGWVVPPMAASIPAKPGASHPFDYVPEADKFVLLTVADNAAVYDIEPPQDPSLTWGVTRRPVDGAAIQSAYVTGKRWSYAPSVKSFVWMAKSSSGVVAYRPFGV